MQCFYYSSSLGDPCHNTVGNLLVLLCIMSLGAFHIAAATYGGPCLPRARECTETIASLLLMMRMLPQTHGGWRQQCARLAGASTQATTAWPTG
jgi:hypothetical protein